jgi:plasmid stabilization system protein ParE
MPDYTLTLDAEADLLQIARYTVQRWGKDQARIHQAKLEVCFEKIATENAIARSLPGKRSDLQFVRCEHHYVFFLHHKAVGPLIIAVLHERMNLIQRVQKRLNR